MSTSAALLTPSGQHAIITPAADGTDRPLVRAASILAALTGITLTAYLLVIAAHDVPFLIRARLATLTAVLVLLTGAALITLVALRVQRRQRADELVALRKHLDRQVDELKRRQDRITDQLARIEAALTGAAAVVHPREPAPEERVNGEPPEGLDAEVIALARRIGQQMGCPPGIERSVFPLNDS